MNPESRRRTQNAQGGAKSLKERACWGEAIGPSRDVTARATRATCCRHGVTHRREEIEVILRQTFLEAQVFFSIP